MPYVSGSAISAETSVCSKSGAKLFHISSINNLAFYDHLNPADEFLSEAEYLGYVSNTTNLINK